MKPSLTFAAAALAAAAALSSLLSSRPAVARTVADGRFGRALSLHETTAHAAINPVYTVIPFTVECWAKLPSKENFNVLVANERKSSGTHWEIFTEAKTGHLAGFMTQWRPDHVRSKVDVCDGQWHHVALSFDGRTMRLYADGKEVASQAVRQEFTWPDSTPLTIGHVEGVRGQKGALIDEVRISRVARVIKGVPDAPLPADAHTIALWRFDEDESATSFADASKTGNPVVLGRAPAKTGTSDSDNRWMQMDFGPFFSATFPASFPDRPNLTAKGVAVRLAKDAAVCFDTELLRPAIAWTGDFINLTPVREGLAGPPSIAGRPAWGTLPLPGWSSSDSFADPRPRKMGPLPRDVGRYRGLYVHGDRIVFAYAVAGTEVLESWSLEEQGGTRAFARTLRVAPHTSTLRARLFDAPQGTAAAPPSVHLIGPGTLEGDQRSRGLTIAPSDKPVILKVLLSTAAPAEFRKLAETSPAPVDLATLIAGGPARYPTPVVTKGTLGPDDEPYTVDTLTAPDDNPWKSFLRFGGHDFLPGGELVACSVSGDVWIVSGIDAKLEKLSWRRFATGLFQPLGLKVLGGKVYVLERSQITRLHDLNGDGEADFYENFNNDGFVTTNGHAYATNLEADPEGNFYYTRCGDDTPDGGTVLKVAKDGSSMEVIATGLRNPNGMGVSPTGEVYEADNQGEWVPASRLDLVRKGDFLGFVPMSKRKVPPRHPGKPLCWMPQNVDNSSGGQCWVTSDRWGPFERHMLHTSYGAASLLLVLQETVNGQVQGGVVRFPLSFATGIMRARFSPADGQLYVSGLRGWQTAGARPGAIQRVRYTGRPVRMPSALRVHENGLRLAFTCPLDKASAADVENWTVLVWNYRWTSAYGSRHWSVEDPTQQGYDELEVRKATLLPDGRTVFLEIEEVGPVMQMQVAFRIRAADGTPLKADVHNTVHETSPAFDPDADAGPAAAR